MNMATPLNKGEQTISLQEHNRIVSTLQKKFQKQRDINMDNYEMSQRKLALLRHELEAEKLKNMGSLVVARRGNQ